MSDKTKPRPCDRSGLCFRYELLVLTWLVRFLLLFKVAPALIVHKITFPLDWTVMRATVMPIYRLLPALAALFTQTQLSQHNLGVLVTT